jgi:hypothetical protein
MSTTTRSPEQQLDPKQQDQTTNINMKNDNNDNNPEPVPTTSKEERRLLLANAVQDVASIRQQIVSAMTAKKVAKSTDPPESLTDAATQAWKLMQSVQAAWGSQDAACNRIQGLLQQLALTLSGVSSASVEQVRTQLGEEAAENAVQARMSALNCLQLLYYMDHLVRVSSTVLRLSKLHLEDPAATEGGLVDVPDEEISAGLARFTSIEAEQDLTKYQQLVLYLLNQAYLRGYRRYGSDMFVRRLTPEGYDTYAWRKISSIKDFVYDVTRKEMNFAQWCNLTSNVNNINSVTEYLSTCRDVQLPDLKKTRFAFSFRNGLYMANRNEFYPHDSAPLDPQLTTLVACKYFDLDFKDYTEEEYVLDWFKIPTPSLQGILDHQKFEEPVSRWLYVFLGRLLYEVGDLDGWQVIPFFKGQAGTGKSTLLMRVCAGFFEPEDVGVLSNNIERKFGLSAIADKLLFVAPEIKGDLQMEQAEFQSVVSGEACQINIKYKKAETLSKWTVPGVLAGNEAPNWVDNSGSVSRRMVLFDFCHRVDNADMELGKKLTAEMPAILLKCNRAYLDAVAKHAQDSIWKHLPKYFMQTKQDLVESVNSLESFLASGSVVVDNNAYMPLEDFVGLYHMHCDTRSLPRMKVNKDFRDRLTNHSVHVDKKSRMVYPRDGSGIMTGGMEWLLGIDVRSAFEACDEVDPSEASAAGVWPSTPKISGVPVAVDGTTTGTGKSSKKNKHKVADCGGDW